MDASKDFYAVLGVSPHADAAVVRAAYRAMSQLHHPDKAPADQKAAATRRVAEINEAYQTLGNPESRRAYDSLRGSSQHEATGAHRPHSNGASANAADSSRLALWAVLALSTPFALALSFEKKTLLRISWEFVTAGFVAPSSHVLHWGIFITIMILALALASKTARVVAART